MTHTATPWKVHPGIIAVGNHNKGIQVGPNQTAVANVIGAFEQAQPGAECEANAAFIVQACNAYDAHVTRIAELEKALRDILDPDTNGCSQRHFDVYKAARAALAKGEA